jgi:pilus assembly protein CpaE
MHELSVVILAIDDEQRAILQMLVEGTAVAKASQVFGGFPAAASDPILRRIQDAKPGVALVDIPSRNPDPAIRAIELLHAEVPGLTVFAVGDMTQPQVIVSAMRSGAREFIGAPVTTNNLLDAIVRLSASKRKTAETGKRGQVFTLLNAKGGSGATTVAVNTALTLQTLHGNTALVDMALLGHASLHLNVKPTYNVLDALRNLERLDRSLLEGYMTRHAGGLHLLAGPPAPQSLEASTSEFARLFDLLVSHYHYVVVDSSSRLDRATRVVCELSARVLIVAQADLPSLWSAARVQRFVDEGGGRERVNLVLNRYRRIPGFEESEIESATGAKVLWKLPSHFPVVSRAIDSGTPVVQQNHSEIARSFAGLVSALVDGNQTKSPRSWSFLRGA